ncbi:MAG: extracellular solute-binding protein [Spirochaetales bacterium]|nr:extracellular solute-binding protein [Spirochaetales bacterium]
MKKICLLTLLFIFVSSMITFATGGQETGPKGKTVITYTRWAGTREAEDFQKLVDLFMAQHPEIYVRAEFLPWGAYWEKLKTSILSGDAADVISLSQIQASPYITKGAFKTLDDIPGARERLAEMQPGAQEAVVFKEKIYAIPVGSGVRAMIYNKDLFDEAGVPYFDNTIPVTWDEFIKRTKKLTKIEGEEVVQYAAHFHKQEMYEAMIYQMGGRLMDNNIKPTKMLINSPEGIAGLKLMRRLIDEQILPPHTGEWSGPWGTPDSAIVTGKVAIMHAGPWGLGPVEDARINYGTAPLPMGVARATRGYINSLAIYRDSKNTDAAWTFIEWMTSAEGQIEFTKTGDLPANKNALEKAKTGGDRPPEVMAAFFSDLPYVITGPMLPSDEMATMLDDLITQFLQGRITAEEAAAMIEEEGNALIEDVYSSM